MPSPKSTGRDAFNLDWAAGCDPALGQRSPSDVQRTLCELTAQTIADAIGHCNSPLRAVYVCGGGAHNAFLMSRLSALLETATVETTAALGLHPDWVEAAAFAWLAWRRLQELPGNLYQVTGARQQAVLGGLYCPALATSDNARC
jgi:anhydro-N-acetylmuramic acid kinase